MTGTGTRTRPLRPRGRRGGMMGMMMGCAGLALVVGMMSATLSYAAAKTARNNDGISDEAPVIESTFTLRDLGFTDDLRARDTRAAIVLPFSTRADRVLLQATLTLNFAGRSGNPAIDGVEILVNDEYVDRIDNDQAYATGGKVVVPIPPALIGGRNTLTLRLSQPQAGGCGDRVPAGLWTLLEGGSVSTRSTVLRLPDDLAILPLPFFDANFDRATALSITLPRAPTVDDVRVAALLASWVGVWAGSQASFSIAVGDLPRENSIVLVDSVEAAKALGLPAITGPTLQFVGDPADPRGPRKHLMIGGRTREEMETATLALVAKGTSLQGNPVHPTASAHARPEAAAPYDAPRWAPFGETIAFAQIPGGDHLVHEGTSSGTLRLQFRVTPDLFLWPWGHPRLDVIYSVSLPANAPPPRVDVELNGSFLGRLTTVDLSGGRGSNRMFLPFHPDRLSGYNEIAFHVDYGNASSCGDEDLAAARFIIGGESALRLDGAAHFAGMPDVSLFVNDGFPFTRRADLSETLVVLPDHPQIAEIETLLSMMAHFASVTGGAATGLAVTTPQALDSHHDIGSRDLLVVGTMANHALIRRWQSNVPFGVESGRPHAKAPALGTTDVVAMWLQGRSGDAEVARANAVLRDIRGLSVVVQLESPYAPNRSALIVTALGAEDMPTIATFQGHAEGRAARNDLLLAAGGSRWMFRVGPTYATGEVHPWRRFLWFLAQHWIVLFPCILLGVSTLGLTLHRILQERWRIRALHSEEAPS